MKFFAALFFLVAATRGLALTERELDAVGRRVWQNECAGTRDGLTSWNEGEGFASLGIGHFIWYPAGARGPFEESFPALVRFLAAQGARPPPWLDGACPWRTRAEFQAAFHGEKLNALRELLMIRKNYMRSFVHAHSHLKWPMPRLCVPLFSVQSAKKFLLLRAEVRALFLTVGLLPIPQRGARRWSFLRSQLVISSSS